MLQGATFYAYHAYHHADLFLGHTLRWPRHLPASAYAFAFGIDGRL